MDSALSIQHVQRASELLDGDTGDHSGLDIDALRGRLAELTARRGHPQVTLAIERIAEAHRCGEPAAWIGRSTSLFYPPDMADWHLDWSALALLRLNNRHQAARAADKLLQSGAFGIVVIDLIGCDDTDVPTPLIHRLKRQAKSHDSAALFLTRTGRDAVSVSNAIDIRARARWTGIDADRLRLQAEITKDRRRGPGDQIEEEYDGPLGLH